MISTGMFVLAVAGLIGCLVRMNTISRHMVGEWDRRTGRTTMDDDSTWGDPRVQACRDGGVDHSFRDGRCFFCGGVQCKAEHRHEGRCHEAIGHPTREHRAKSGHVWVFPARIEVEA